MTSLEGYVSRNPFMYYTNAFADHCYCNGQCQQRGMSFSAQDSRMRCMPHTIHLAAIKVLYFTNLIITSRLTFCLAPGRDQINI